jgi:ABC-type Mn2+/Zn2+ transport system permease subunit
MTLWVFMNAMHHSGLYYWPVWYSAVGILLGASGLFVWAARANRRDSKGPRWLTVLSWLFAAVAGAFGLWGLVLVR